MQFLFELIGQFIADTIGGVLGERLQRRSTRRHEERGLHQCAIRVVAGSVPGLSGRWKHGTAKIEYRQIEFIPRRGRRPSVAIRVDSVDRDFRRPRGAELWSLNPRTRLVTLVSPGATVEWAVLNEDPHGLVAAIGH